MLIALNTETNKENEKLKLKLLITFEKNDTKNNQIN